jgi:hypothetical protein
MANAQTRNILTRRVSETVYGSLMIGAITNGDFDVALEPGLWSVTLLVNADTVSAGTITVSALNSAGTALTEESYGMYQSSTGSPAASISLIDLVGPVFVIPNLGGTGVNLPFAAVATYAGFRFTIASIAGASAGNRIDYIMQRIS